MFRELNETLEASYANKKKQKGNETQENLNLPVELRNIQDITCLLGPDRAQVYLLHNLYILLALLRLLLGSTLSEYLIGFVLCIICMILRLYWVLQNLVTIEYYIAIKLNKFFSYY